MKRTLRAARLAAVALLASSGALAAPPTLITGPPLKPEGSSASVPLWTSGHAPVAGQTLKFKSLPLKLGVNKVQLSGGKTVVNLLDWRSVAISDVSNGDVCTLSLVGPRAVLLAAHCVDTGLKPGVDGVSANAAEVDFTGGPTPYQMSCTLSPDYRTWDYDASGTPRASTDYALCELDRAVTSIRYETLAMDAHPVIGAPVTLVGYGCISLGISEDETRYTYLSGDKILRIADAPINATGITLENGRPALYWRTLSPTGLEPNLCYGDSGGPVMAQKPGGNSRKVIGVNSALGATPTATHAQPSFYSYLSPLSTKAFEDFVTAWSAEGEDGHANHPRIVCGFNRKAGLQGCRG